MAKVYEFIANVTEEIEALTVVDVLKTLYALPHSI